MKIEIDLELADNITLASMKEHLECLRDQLDAHKTYGQYMHKDDVRDTETKWIPAFETLIHYYGG